MIALKSSDKSMQSIYIEYKIDILAHEDPPSIDHQGGRAGIYAQSRETKMRQPHAERLTRLHKRKPMIHKQWTNNKAYQEATQKGKTIS